MGRKTETRCRCALGAAVLQTRTSHGCRSTQLRHNPHPQAGARLRLVVKNGSNVRRKVARFIPHPNPQRHPHTFDCGVRQAREGLRRITKRPLCALHQWRSLQVCKDLLRLAWHTVPRSLALRPHLDRISAATSLLRTAPAPIPALRKGGCSWRARLAMELERLLRNQRKPASVAPVRGARVPVRFPPSPPASPETGRFETASSGLLISWAMEAARRPAMASFSVRITPLPSA